MKFLKTYWFIVCLLAGVSVFLTGCGVKEIKFKRESEYNNYMKSNRIAPPKDNKTPTIMNSNGVYIYKAKQSTTRDDINFGPKDVKFNLPNKI